MNTKFFSIAPNDITHPDLSVAADILRSGGLVAFPTETVYGLGGDATDISAAEKIYAAKGRPSDNPLIVHIADPKDAERYAFTNDVYYRLAKAFMPGPLTVILPKRDTVPDTVTGGLPTVALRCPSHPLARALIRAAGVGIAAPSANRSGSPSPSLGEHVAEHISKRECNCSRIKIKIPEEADNFDRHHVRHKIECHEESRNDHQRHVAACSVFERVFRYLIHKIFITGDTWPPLFQLQR